MLRLAIVLLFFFKEKFFSGYKQLVQSSHRLAPCVKKDHKGNCNANLELTQWFVFHYLLDLWSVFYETTFLQSNEHNTVVKYHKKHEIKNTGMIFCALFLASWCVFICCWAGLFHRPEQLMLVHLAKAKEFYPRKIKTDF